MSRAALVVTVVAAACLVSVGPAVAASAAPVTSSPISTENVQGFELIQQVGLANGRGALRIWRNTSNGYLHAEVVNAPQGTVAVERRDDGSIRAFAVNPTNGGSASTGEVKDPAPLRGVYNSNGLTTVTTWVTSA